MEPKPLTPTMVRYFTRYPFRVNTALYFTAVRIGQIGMLLIPLYAVIVFERDEVPALVQAFIPRATTNWAVLFLLVAGLLLAFSVRKGRKKLVASYEQSGVGRGDISGEVAFIGVALVGIGVVSLTSLLLILMWVFVVAVTTRSRGSQSTQGHNAPASPVQRFVETLRNFTGFFVGVTLIASLYIGDMRGGIAGGLLVFMMARRLIGATISASQKIARDCAPKV